MKILVVIVTLFISFISLMAIVIAFKFFGFSPSDFHDPVKTFLPATVVGSLGILLAPIAITVVSQRFFLRQPLGKLGFQGPLLIPFIKGAGIGLVAKGLALATTILWSLELTVTVPTFSFWEWIPYFGWFLSALILNSLSEELAYRAFPIQNVVSPSNIRNQILIWLWAVLFSVMHFILESPDLQHFLYRLSFGLAAGALFLNRKSLWLVVGFHTGWNFVVMAFSDSDWREGALVQFKGLHNSTGMLSNVIVLSAIYFFVLYRRAAPPLESF